MKLSPPRLLLLLLSLALSAAACLDTVGSTDGGTDAGQDAGSDAGVDEPRILGVANWNVEWFGDEAEGPPDDALQVAQVAKVIAGGGAEVWALVEVVAAPRFGELLRALPDHEGFVANDARVSRGSSAYSDFEQKPAFVWRRGVLEEVSASVILTEYDYVFAGRPPLVVDAIAHVEGVRVPVTFVVVHLKAQLGDDRQDWERRQGAALRLKAWLDALPAGRAVLVLGDWNDDLDHSIASELDGGVLDSPFRALVEDPDFTFLTAPLTAGNLSTTVRYDTPIDHQLATAPLASRFVQGSLQVLRPEGWSPPISGYASTTSDHYPVRTRFALQGTAVEQPDAGSCTPPRIVINELLPQPGPVGAPQFDRQFIELYNPGTASLELSGWKLDDDKSYLGVEPTRHVFAPGTRLDPGEGLVVFSGASALPSGAVWAVVANGGSGLRLNRGVNDGSSGDAVYLRDASGELVDHVSYKDTWFDVSLNRAPDLDGCAPLGRHDVAAPGRLNSPGTRIDGTPF